MSEANIWRSKAPSDKNLNWVRCWDCAQSVRKISPTHLEIQYRDTRVVYPEKLDLNMTTERGTEASTDYDPVATYTYTDSSGKKHKTKYKVNDRRSVETFEYDGSHRLDLSKDENHIVDLGCGRGSLVRHLSEKYPDKQIIGLDAILDTKQWNDPRFVRGTLTDLPFADGSVDTFFVNANFLEYKDVGNIRETILREISRKLRPGGRVDALLPFNVLAMDLIPLLEKFPELRIKVPDAATLKARHTKLLAIEAERTKLRENSAHKKHMGALIKLRSAESLSQIADSTPVLSNRNSKGYRALLINLLSNREYPEPASSLVKELNRYNVGDKEYPSIVQRIQDFASSYVTNTSADWNAAEQNPAPEVVPILRRLKELEDEHHNLWSIEYQRLVLERVP